VVTAAYKGGLAIYFGNGSGKSWREAATPHGLPCEEDPEPGDSQSGGWANRILLHDIDGDGHLDVAASYYAGPRVWRGDGKGRWQSYSQGLPRPLIGGLFWGIAVGDVNTDGRLDLAVANTVNGPEVFLQNHDGSWQQTPDVMPSLLGGAMSVALGDINGDGQLDLITGGIRSKKVQEGYGLFVLSGDGKGGWTEAQGTGLPAMHLSFPWGISLPDVDKDGQLDLAVATGGTIAGKVDNPQPTKSALPLLQVWLNRL
jgi:FG-GAP-like repeat